MSDYGTFLAGAAPSTIGAVLCFGTVTFTAAALASRTFLLGDNRAILAAVSFSPHHKDRIAPVENSFVSIFSLFFHLNIFGLVLLATYIIQHHPPFPHDMRAEFDPDYLVFLGILSCILALSTLRPNFGRKKRGGRQGGTGQLPGTDESSTFHDGNSTIASGLPSIATRRSFRSGASSRSGRSSRSGGSGGASRGSSQNSYGSSQGSVEEIDLQDGKSSMQLDTLEEESQSLVSHDRSSQLSNGSGLDDVSLLDEDGSKSTNKSGDRSKLSGRSASASTKTDLMNLHQTLEVRGLLSSFFIFYQLTGAELSVNEVNIFHNASRIGASFFVFLTGFGHATYFYARNSCRPGRVMQVLFRMNLTAFFLCATMNKPYILYYVCPLHSVAFLITFCVMRINQSVNYDRYGLRMKLAALALIIFAVWDLNLGIFDLVFSPFFSRNPSLPGVVNGPLWEWYYQSHMHHWIWFVGIVYAINYPVTSLLLNKMEIMSNSGMALAKGTIGLSFVAAISMWIQGPFSNSTYYFAKMNPYYAFIPVLAFVYFRNSTSFLRKHHLKALKIIGKFSLEIFLFHHYFFLADHGDSTLVLIPGYPKCNIIVSIFLLFLVARTTHNLTTILSGMLFPVDDDNKCIRSLAIIIIGTLGFYCTAFALDAMGLAGTTNICIGILLLGIVTYKIVLDMTWTEYKNVGRQLATDLPAEETIIAKASPPIIGIMVILVLGISCHILSLAGASGGKLPLEHSCEAYANEGTWAPVTACNEYQRGLDTRQLDVGAYYRDCDDTAVMHWGWRETAPNLKCQFRSRPSSEIQKKLSHRKIIFIGDLMVRELYNALCRLLGDQTAGMYDASVADHSDISNRIGNIHLEYKWAPLAFDQVSKMKEIRTKGNAGIKSPDLLIVGGGTLDRLHVWATDEDQASHNVAVQKLAKELEFASAPAIWCTPTTVNTPALSNEEKRNQMNEMTISEVRKMYKELEVESSANFVLDGPSYSRGRVSESYDGILYPRMVYDAGIQIAANSFDWLLPPADNEDDLFEPPLTGLLGTLPLGLMMVCLCIIGLFCLDGYFGFSYLPSLFVRRSDRRKRMYQDQNGASAVMPNDIFEEAFIPYHQLLKLPVHNLRAGSRSSRRNKKQDSDRGMEMTQQDSDILSLLDNDSLLGNQSISRRSNATR
mmetsp:Transcript_13749/g.20953  ORF Transcript_13749/g.20953 Transcript_13749/m.20953 type:complete len:1164 (+) Transcript_13749:138-3629(+)|eukprot:CAMPEP_0178902698 /NCGR_PEP_ID=MMETSP0786-20121207/4751_1 /TAXON_ID=186022 /ORGANISM="Thalassionema frauenfeldii, Strain CCMP 1798" /LENGTH=1163 /DNA_ID=CAMNT_0020573997 /DNA_START=50 /DNA_END=3541 /DNA_ORIENTATION=-